MSLITRQADCRRKTLHDECEVQKRGDISIYGDIHYIFIANHEIILQHDRMARLSRIVVPGCPHHVTQRGVRSMDVFHEGSDRREYLGMPGEEIARHGVSVHVWCLMTNHVHFVAVPHREESRAKGFGRAHRRHTHEELRCRGPRVPVSRAIQLVCSGRGSPFGGCGMWS